MSTTDATQTIELPCDVLDDAKFLAWLDSKADDQVVGYTAESDRCPIAMYLTETLPTIPGFDARGIPWKPIVGDSVIRLEARINDLTRAVSNSCDTPPWAKKFIHVIDEMVKDEYGDEISGEPVTASQVKPELHMIRQGIADAEVD